MKWLLIALLIFLNCSDKTPLVEVETDPTEPLLGCWSGIYSWEDSEFGLSRVDYVIVFERNGIVKGWYRTVFANDVYTQSWLGDVKYIYDIDWKLIRFSYLNGELYESISYNGGDHFTWPDKLYANNASRDIIFTKQDTLPAWAAAN